MEPISNGDRLMALLRQRLQEKVRVTGSKAGNSREGDQRAASPTGLEAVALISDADQAQARRACIQALLADQLGSHLLNDANFQQVVTRVTQTIVEDPEAVKLLDRILSDIRSR